MKAYTPPPTYVRLPPVQSGESTAMTANRDINLYNDNGVLKTNTGGSVSSVGTAYDQSLNTTDAVAFASMQTSTIKSSATYSHSVPDTANDPLVTTSATQALTAKTYNGMTITATTGTLTMENGSSFVLTHPFEFKVTASANTWISFPATGFLTLVDTSTAQNLSNKTYNGMTITGTTGTLTLANGSTFTLNGAFNLEITATGPTQITLPGIGAITLVDLNSAQALTNKTINGNTITSGSGTLTLNPGFTLNAQGSSGNSLILLATLNTTWTSPGTGVHTLVGTTATQALTNKTISGLTVSTTTGTLTIANGHTLITTGTTGNSLTLAATTTTTWTSPGTGSQTLVSTTASQALSAKTITLANNSTTVAALAFGTGGSMKTTPVAGDMQYNTVVPRFTTTSGTGNLMMEFFTIADTNLAVTNGTGLQNVFQSAGTRDVFSTAVATTYYFEFFYKISHGSGAHTLSLAFTSAITGSISYTVTTYEGNGPTSTSYSTAITAFGSTVVDVSKASTTTTHCLGRGMLFATTAGPVTPHFEFSANPGVGPNLLVGSYIIFRPMANNVTMTIGPWS